MAFRHVERTTTTAPRALTRAGQTGKVIDTMFGPMALPGAAPSVGGTAEVEHDVWRCGHCSALAVTQAGTPPPTTCGKCHNR